MKILKIGGNWRWWKSRNWNSKNWSKDMKVNVDNQSMSNSVTVVTVVAVIIAVISSNRTSSSNIHNWEDYYWDWWQWQLTDVRIGEAICKVLSLTRFYVYVQCGRVLGSKFEVVRFSFKLVIKTYSYLRGRPPFYIDPQVTLLLLAFSIMWQ